MKVYKYSLPLNPPEDGHNASTSVELPTPAKVIKIAMQGNEAYLWAEVTPDSHILEAFGFVCVWTGRQVPVGCEYLETLEDEDGFVWHIYQITDARAYYATPNR